MQTIFRNLYRQDIYRHLRSEGQSAMEALGAAYGPGPLPVVRTVLVALRRGEHSEVRRLVGDVLFQKWGGPECQIRASHRESG